MRLLFVLLFAALPALAQSPVAISVLERRNVLLDASQDSASHELRRTRLPGPRKRAPGSSGSAA
jgi:hypothetical protein